jgi:hypothetical protein
MRRLNLRRRPAGKRPKWLFIIKKKLASLLERAKPRVFIGIDIGSLFCFQSLSLSPMNINKTALIPLFKRIRPALIPIVIRI